jgi:hypothetical protein
MNDVRAHGAKGLPSCSWRSSEMAWRMRISSCSFAISVARRPSTCKQGGSAARGARVRTFYLRELDIVRVGRFRTLSLTVSKLNECNTRENLEKKDFQLFHVSSTQRVHTIRLTA